MKIVLHLATAVCVLMVQISGHRFTKRSSGSSGSSEESDSTCPQGPVPTDEQCQILEAAFMNQDFNRDGQLTLKEFQLLFDIANKDGNGFLTFIEFASSVTIFNDVNLKTKQYRLWEMNAESEIARVDLPQILANHNVCDECTCGITLEEYKTYYLQNGIFE